MGTKLHSGVLYSERLISRRNWINRFFFKFGNTAIIPLFLETFFFLLIAVGNHEPELNFF